MDYNKGKSAIETASNAAYITIKPSLAEQFQAAMQDGRVIFFSAPCGFGKTTTARALLEGKNVWAASAEDPGFMLPDPKGNWDVLLIDDLQYFKSEVEQQTLCTLIRENPKRRFVLLSRTAPPSWLVAFDLVGLMLTLDAKALLFDRETTARHFQMRGIEASELELTAIQKESLGYALGVSLTARYMMDGTRFGPNVSDRVYRDLFSYYETAVYRRFDFPIRRFLLEMAPFESFDLELARMVSGNSRAGEQLDWLRNNTTMLLCEGTDRYRFWAVFRSFLLWEMSREYSEEKRRALFDRGGLYFELRGDDVSAVECYARGGERAKVCDLLIRNAEHHPAQAHYSEMEKYYRALAETEILASPALMQGMSMLCALMGEYKESERWYHELELYADRCESTDAARKHAKSRLVWLDISLPQRSVSDLIAAAPQIFTRIRRSEIELPAFSVTSSLPSLMNGGKDFSDWSRQDELLYRTLRLPMETIFGRDSVGMADCAIAESKFEKGGDIGPRMLSLVSHLSDVQKSGTPDIEFAIVGLLARNQLDSGQPDEAIRTLQAQRERFVNIGETRFLPNLDAALCRIALYTGDLDAADAWYRDKAPRNPLRLNVMLRYQYLTQAMVELAEGKNDAMLLTLAPLEEYCATCARHIDTIQLHTLRAIALFRKKSLSWRTELETALREAEKYRFIRTLSRYGAALLPMLEGFKWSGDDRWFKMMCLAVRDQSAKYPSALRPRLAPSEALTSTELQVLRLICADKSNAEIGEVLDIKLPTVKSHVSHILQKLGVNRRSEARTAAQKLWLVPKDM